MIRLLCLLLITASYVYGQVPGREVNLNSVVDLLLAGVEEELGRGSGDLGKLPDLNKTWSKGPGFLSVSLTLNCSGGRVASLGSVLRDGDVFLRKDGPRVTLRASLTLRDLVISYDRCKVKVAGISTSNPLFLKTSSVSLVSQISATRTPNNCTNELDYMEVTDLGELTAEMGDTLGASIKETIFNFVAKRSRPSALRSINSKLEDATTKALLKRKNICTKIFFYVRG